MTAPEFDVDALAAHREALAEAISMFGEPMPQDYKTADAVLAYFADPAHGLTVEADRYRAGIRRALYEGGLWCGECDPADPDDECCVVAPRLRADLAHGLVRDEPSEDEVWICDDCQSTSQNCIAHRAAPARVAPARSDDGRTAVSEGVTVVTDDPSDGRTDERTAVELADGYWAAADALERDGEYGTAPLRLRHLAARLRHDDGEADR